MLKITAFMSLLIYVVSIYSLKIPSINGGTIDFNNYRNKKILLVNTATNCPAATEQFIQLQQLYQLHQDSLVIIAFPTNSFGSEPQLNSQIYTSMLNNFGVTFPIAAKSSVTGEYANCVYQWLGNKLQNDKMNAKPRRNFDKLLIDKSGMLVSFFDSSISPMSLQLQNAINNY